MGVNFPIVSNYLIPGMFFICVWRACGHVDVGTSPHQILTATLTLSQPRVADYAYSWVHNRRVYSFIWHPRNMKKETDTKRDKSI
jgi:hypothetical protein